ncbi:YesL family protein [Gracilibacillus sp. D59]|uniref:YesL family protein n=1 Tax=Gracilibacillus sp. D59 TaxID=3457434 RepID=UPI003FCE1B67
MAHTVTERPLYIAVQYFYYFLITNIHFMLANVLFLLAFVFVEMSVQNIILFYIALLPAGPSWAALYASMGKMIRERDLSPTKDFWKYYKNNFRIATKYWLIQWTIMTILIVDMYYASHYLAILSPVFLILLIFMLFLMLYAFPILTRFEVKLKNLFIVSIYAIFRYFKTTLFHISTLVSLAIIYYFAPGITVWFCMSVAAFFIMINMKKPFKLMEQELAQSERDEYEEN